MARAKKITTDELIRFIDVFHFEKPGEKISIPSLGVYLRNKGVDVADYLIRRDAQARKYITMLNSKNEDDIHREIVSFHPLDVANFLEVNMTKDRLVVALTQRDNYYASIASSAARTFKKAKELEMTNAELMQENLSLQTKLAVKAEKAEYSAMQVKDTTIQKLKRIIDTYIYPEIANTLLEKEGLLEIANQIVAPGAVEENLVTASTEIKKFKHSAINSLMNGFGQ